MHSISLTFTLMHLQCIGRIFHKIIPTVLRQLLSQVTGETTIRKELYYKISSTVHKRDFSWLRGNTVPLRRAPLAPACSGPARAWNQADTHTREQIYCQRRPCAQRKQCVRAEERDQRGNDKADQWEEVARDGTAKQRRGIGMDFLLFSLGKQIPHTHVHTRTADPLGLLELEMR